VILVRGEPLPLHAVAELDLLALQGSVPIELSGLTELPPVGVTAPIVVTLGPHGFYWLSLATPASSAEIAAELHTPGAMTLPGDWRALFRERTRAQLARAPARCCRHRRWFGGQRPARIKFREIREPRPPVRAGFSAPTSPSSSSVTEGPEPTYVFPLALRRTGEKAEALDPQTSRAPSPCDSTCAIPAPGHTTPGVL